MPETNKAGTSSAPVRACPICGASAVLDYRPFCSKRCADIDLHRWLKGSYAIPVEPDADEDAQDPAPPAARDPD